WFKRLTRSDHHPCFVTRSGGVSAGRVTRGASSSPTRPLRGLSRENDGLTNQSFGRSAQDQARALMLSLSMSNVEFFLRAAILDLRDSRSQRDCNQTGWEFSIEGRLAAGWTNMPERCFSAHPSLNRLEGAVPR